MSSFTSPEFYKLIKPFVFKMLGSFSVEASVQRKFKNGKKMYSPLRRDLTVADFRDHFYLSPLPKSFWLEGSLGVIPPIIEGYLRFICIDIDDPALKDKVYDKLLPFLDKNNIPYIVELGGEKLDRCHIWILTYLKPTEAKVFFKNLLEAAGFSLQELAEVFGINKPRNLIRLPGGPHLWRGGGKFPLEINYEHIYDPIQIMKTFIDLPVVDMELIIQNNLQEYLISKELPKRTVEEKARIEKFRYKSRELPVPAETPSYIAPIFRECQALNQALIDTIKETKSHDLGELYHWQALQLQRLGKISDINTKTEEGKEWFNSITSNAAHAKTHNWKSNQDKIAANPNRFIPSCKTLEMRCGNCNGCPFKGVISSPETFLSNAPTGRTLIEERGLLTAKAIQENTFLDFKDAIFNSIEDHRAITLLLASPQGVGKSSLVSKLAVEIAEKGKRVLIAVNTATVAMEHKGRIEAAGGKAFLLMSHKNIFEYLSPFPCPKNKEIQALHELGVESAIYKSDFCKGCPLYDKCYFPTQYKEVHEEKHNIVIMQHAHLQCQEVVYDLIQKNFDILFIDESFIKSCFTFIKPIKKEIELLKYCEFKWAIRLAEWLEGKELACGNLTANEKDLKHLKVSFNIDNLPWTVPDYIRYYNQKRKVHPISGLEIVYELPPIPRLILTDATPPLDMIKALTGVEDIKVFGHQEVLDIKQIHKDNEIIQLLDSSSSVTFLEKDKNMENLLLKIGELCEIVYKDKKVLFTIYRKHYEKVMDFFSSHPQEFPEVINRIRSDYDSRPCDNPIYLDWMDKGTNEFADYDVQFLMAGIYFIPEHYRMETYKINSVENHFRKLKGQKLLNLIYPTEIKENKYTKSERLRIRRHEIIDGVAGVYEYPSYHYSEPEEKWFKCLYHLNVANTQQAVRLRFTPEKPRIVYILNNYHFPSLVVTQSITYKEFIKPLEY